MGRHTLDKFIAPTLTAIAALLFWPLALLLKLQDMRLKKMHPPSAEPREFAVGMADLQQALTIAEIERREKVFDPLGAVPALPFGHLNSAWRRFAETAGPNDAVWSFSARWKPAWGREELRAGYVLVDNGVIGAHFLALRKAVEENA